MKNLAQRIGRKYSEIKQNSKNYHFYGTLPVCDNLISVMTGAVKETTADTDSVKLPVIMYHSLLKDEKLQNDYTVSPTLFENDLKYLTENGYTTVVVKDLTDYVYGKKSLPEKCIMLTFDDGYYNNYYYALSLLENTTARRSYLRLRQCPKNSPKPRIFP